MAYLCDKDLDQLLLILLNMNSTIKHFKAANRLLFALLQQRKFRRIL